MQISTTEALSLLKKWHEEKRLVNCAIVTVVGGKAFQIAALYGVISEVPVEGEIHSRTCTCERDGQRGGYLFVCEDSAIGS